jgi:DNA-binding GntR family transcriptional regulator
VDHDHVPLSSYLLIADKIAARIQAGHYPRGTRLPSPYELSQEGHPVGAVRDALRLLARHGWAEVGPDGASYYVAEQYPSDEAAWNEVRRRADAT